MSRIRTLPRHVIVSRMKRVHLRQVDIAALLGVSQGTVNLVISRKLRTPVAERVWQEIEKALIRLEAVS